MPVFEYTALEKSGKSVKGIIDADSTIAARQRLRSTGKYPVEVRETVVKPKTDRFSSLKVAHFFSRVKPDEIHAMTRQLSTLVGAGVPLVGALDALKDQTVNAYFKTIIAQVKNSVNEGSSLTQALSQHPRLFSGIYINMVRAGEASGSLDVVLDRLAEFGERQQALKGRFRAALIYPIFMGFVGAAVLFFLLSFVVPRITQIFTEMQQVLPLPTVILLGVSDFLQSFWWLLALIFVAVTLVAREIIKRPRGRLFWDRMKLVLPVLGPINQKIAMARFGRTLGSLLNSGVPVITALQIVRNIVNNVLITGVIDEAVEEIQAGKSMSSILARSHWFTPVFVQMISVGEQSGALESMLHKIADAYERDVEASIMGLTSVIEPAMILMMGLVVLFIVVSILLPIFEMNQLVG